MYRRNETSYATLVTVVAVIVFLFIVFSIMGDALKAAPAINILQHAFGG